MKSSKPDSSDHSSPQDDNIQPPSCGLLTPRASRGRFMSCLLIAAVFLVLDLAILFYFMWLPSTKEVEQVAPRQVVVEKNIAPAAFPDAPQQKD